MVETWAPVRRRKRFKIPIPSALGLLFLKEKCVTKSPILFLRSKKLTKKTGPLNQNMGHLVSRGVPGKFMLPLSLEEVWF